jgi:quercetin dioxygenase-like cupin family protein
MPRAVLPPELSGEMSCAVVNFSRGATTGWHMHTGDQLLIITAGQGIVATESERHDVRVGDIVHISAGENHLHGATSESTMSHITIIAMRP